MSIDESTDVEERYPVNVIIATVHADRPGKTFLLTTEFLERANR